MRAFLAALIFCGFTSAALAHDPTGYWAREIAAGHAPSAEWWNNLGSGKGLCCSFADGEKVEDVDWDAVPICEDGKCQMRYRVRLHGEWVVVPDNALVTEPNQFGPAVVWPYRDSEGMTQVRCFLPGAGA